MLEVLFNDLIFLLLKLTLSIFFLAGVIDADYRGNVGVVLFNFTDSDFTSKI